MAATWWTWEQVAHYLLANYPCRNGVAATNLMRSRVADGTFSTRYRAYHDGHVVPIEASEWRDGEWLGWERQEAMGFGAGSYEVEATAVQRPCVPQHATAPKGAGGRPPREIVNRLLVLAGMWIDEHGVPVAGSGEQAALERWLTGHAGDQIKAESRIREIAAQAIGIADAHRRAGN